MEETELMEWNAQGLIPGPKETEEEFLKRAAYCLELKKTLHTALKETLPFEDEVPIPNNFWEEAEQLTVPLFQIKPEWIPVFFSNQQLAPWQGGAAWIFQQTESSPLGAFFQLRRPFLTQKRYLGIYTRNELVAHECAHVGRMAFQEPDFEEVFAYKTSTNPFRRWMGPLITSTSQLRWFMIVLVAIVMSDLALVIMGYSEAYLELMWLKLIPLTMFAYACIGLFARHRVLNKCMAKLQEWAGGGALAVAYRLTDAEIRSFAASTSEQILAYVQKQSCLRWRVIKNLLQI